MSATPGPWEYRLPLDDETNDDGNKYWEVRPETFHTGDGHLCVSAWMSEANARLIAAAPDMLDALKEILELFEGKEDIKDYAGGGQLPNDAMRACMFARAAIAKAKGKS